GAAVVEGARHFSGGRCQAPFRTLILPRPARRPPVPSAGHFSLLSGATAFPSRQTSGVSPTVLPAPLARAVPCTLAAVVTDVALGTPAATLGAEPLSVPQLIAAAEAGDAQAQADLAWRHWFGDGVEQDRELGVRWFRRAADQGHGEACYWLGSAYEEGIGVT